MLRFKLTIDERLLMLAIAAAILLAAGKLLEWKTAGVQLTPLVKPPATTTPTP